MPPSSVWPIGLLLDRVAAVPGGVQNTGLKDCSPPSWAVYKYGAQILAIHLHLAVSGEPFCCGGSELVCLVAMFHPELCSSAAVKAARWAQRDVDLHGIGCLRPGLPRLSEVCLFSLCTQSGCHRLDLPRPRFHHALCGLWLWHSPDVRCRRCCCQCVQLPLLRCHRLGWGHRLAVLHR